MKYANSTLLLILVGMISACSIKPSTKPATPASTVSKEEAGKPAAKAALKPVPVEANKLFQQALVQIKNGQTDDAVVTLEQLKVKYPQFSGSSVNLGLIHLGKNELTKAEKDFLAAIQVNRNNPVAYTHLGIIYRRQGKFKEAEKAYLQAIKIDPNYTLAQLNIGILYDVYLHDAGKALQHYTTYQGLLTEKDKKVNKWIIDLTRRLKAAGNGKGGTT